MKRPLTLIAAGVAALTLVALPASARGFLVVRGTIADLTDSSISVKASNGVVTTCAVRSRHPRLRGYADGDAVQMLCVGRKGHSALVLIRHLVKFQGSVPGTKHDARPTTFGGVITALSDTSISLHDGDRDLTCVIDSTSPPTGDFKVGQHAGVACKDGVLVAIKGVGHADAGRVFIGTVASLDDHSLTLKTEHGPVTCTFGDGTPSLDGIHVGDRLAMACNAPSMQLVLVKKLGGDGAGTGSTPPPPPAPPVTHTETHAHGAVSDVTDTSISVSTDGGTVSCTVGPDSPSVSDVNVNDVVSIGCLDGVLRKLEVESAGGADGGSGDGSGDGSGSGSGDSGF